MSTSDEPLPHSPQLAFAVNECEAITEKAAAHLVAAVEFQRLEIAGRKAHVFRMCMRDHGYIENPAWTRQATPIATQLAKSENISLDEAFEKLRRADMVMLHLEPNEPRFWVNAQ
ncbi:MAG: hypothetical protein ACT4OH_06105 [Methylophilaceae bacterium]